MPVKNITDLPMAIDKFERDIKQYQERSGKAFPEEWRVPTFMKLVPAAYKKELTMQFQMGMTDYSTLSAQIMTFAQQARFDAHGLDDIQVHALALEAWMLETPEDEVL